MVTCRGKWHGYTLVVITTNHCNSFIPGSRKRQPQAAWFNKDTVFLAKPSGTPYLPQASEPSPLTSQSSRQCSTTVIMAGRKPPIFEPNPAVIDWEGPLQYEGLDLWRQAVRREYNRQLAAPSGRDKWVRVALDKPNEGEVYLKNEIPTPLGSTLLTLQRHRQPSGIATSTIFTPTCLRRSGRLGNGSRTVGGRGVGPRDRLTIWTSTRMRTRSTTRGRRGDGAWVKVSILLGRGFLDGWRLRTVAD